MVIKSVEKYKGSTVCVEIDGRANVYINEKIAAEYHLKAGSNIPESALDEIIEADLFRKARERALHLLTDRDYCFVELYNKLEKNYPHEICLSVCRKMAEMGFVNDAAYAEKFARQLFEVKKFGMYRARQEMKRRGLPESVIEEAIEPYMERENVLERLEGLVEKKYSRYLTDEKGVQKVKSALVRLGYSYDDINTVLKNFDEE